MSLDGNSAKILAVAVAIFFLTTSLSGTFLPIYFNESLQMSVSEIVVILLFTFLSVGLIPMLTVRRTKRFERIISLGIILTMIFYVALIFVKSPVILGLAYGVSLATFWPSFNLLMFRLTEIKERALVVSLLSVAIPGVAGVVSPAVGGFVIQTFGFVYLFAASIILFLASFLISLKIRYKAEEQEFGLPKESGFKLFLVTFALSGLSESYWLAYPFFLLKVSSTIVSMGLVVTASSLIITLGTVAVNKLSDIKRSRVEFAVAGAILHSLWYIGLVFATNIASVIALSLLSGLASAFSLSWFVYYGDCFRRQFHASILVMMELGLMVGRIMNLIPTYVFIGSGNYSSYFAVLSAASLSLAPLCLLCANRIRKT